LFASEVKSHGGEMRDDVAYVYVRDLIERLTGVKSEPDEDGDLPVRWENAGFYVRVQGRNNSWIQVFSVAVTDLQSSAELMLKINDINAELRFARAFMFGNQVLIETEIWADDLNPTNFSHACRNVAQATDAYSMVLLEMFGGTSHFNDTKSEDYETPKALFGFGPRA